MTTTRDSAKRCKNVEVFARNSSKAEKQLSQLAHPFLGWRLGQSSVSRGVTQFYRKINAIILFFPRFLLAPLLKIYECQKIFLITGKGRSRYLGLLLFTSQHCHYQESFQSVFIFEESRPWGIGVNRSPIITDGKICILKFKAIKNEIRKH